MTEELLDTIALQDDKGNTAEFTVVDRIELNGANYAVLLPVEESEEDEAVILRILSEDDAGMEFEGLDDEALLDTVFEEFMRRNPEWF